MYFQINNTLKRKKKPPHTLNNDGNKIKKRPKYYHF